MSTQSQSKISIQRGLSRTDCSVLVTILRESGFFYPHEISIAQELMDEALEEGESKSGYHFVVARLEGAPVGYICFGPIPLTQGSYDLYWMVVESKLKGKGIGKALLSESERIMRSEGAERVYIETSGRALYAPTRAFYVHAGYGEEASLRDFYQKGDDKKIFSKLLSPI